MYDIQVYKFNNESEKTIVNIILCQDEFKCGYGYFEWYVFEEIEVEFSILLIEIVVWFYGLS